MKAVSVLLLSLFILSLSIAGDKSSAASAEQQFARMKSLVGTWGGTDDEGNTVAVTYKLVSNGTSLMETLSPANHPDAMITMYHLNGSKLMMTHYCSVGNQPRMRVKDASKDGNSITFSYIDATNLKNIKETHMSRLVVTFRDDEHFSQEWTMSENGKEAHHAVFNFERAR